MKYTSQHGKGVLTLLRICTFLLAVVSFWATAQGMKEYTFSEEWQAYAASLGIQGLLLGLNLSLPAFLRKCETGFSKIVLVLLTCVALLCSSWFSYLYISEQAYGKSWDTESQLLAQDAYRGELFAADTYLEQYDEELEQTLADQITTLYAQAIKMDTGKVDIAEGLDWTAERDTYADADFAARDIMAPVIDAMEQATADNAAQDARQQSAEIVKSMQETLETTIAGLDARIEEANAGVDRAATVLSTAQAQLRNDPDNTDLQNSVNNAARDYDRNITNQSNLMQQRQDYQSARQRVMFYSSVLGMAEEGVSSYFVGANLRAIQRELFGTEPDSERMMALATAIFERLQSAEDLNGSETENNNYQSFLSEMNRFVRYLDNYRTIKTLHNEIQKRTDRLSAGEILLLGDAGDQWKAKWRTEFNDLKAIISGLPIYTLERANSDLDSFDRGASARRLDAATRYYLTNHNPAQQGLIYLYSPYRGIAVFSLFIALLLDVAAFITGSIIDREEESQKKRLEEAIADTDSEDTDAPASPAWELEHALEWNATPPLNRYIFLTGDYQYLDGVMTYKAIERGKVVEVEYRGSALQGGLYFWEDGKLSSLQPVEMCYKGTREGPRDGVYLNARLCYEDQLLTLVQGGEGRHLGTVDPYTPVYQLSEDGYESFAAKDLKGTHGEKVVIALNQTGTRIVAIYIISDTNIT